MGSALFEVVIRPAGPEDAPAVAALGRAMFPVGHVGLLPTDVLEEWAAELFDLDRVRSKLDDVGCRTFLAEYGGEPLGFVRLQRDERPPSVEDPQALELSSLYLREDWIGRGLGAALTVCVLAEAARRTRTVWLWLVEGNHRAGAFYERFGFRVEAVHTFETHGTRAQAAVMVRTLGGGS